MDGADAKIVGLRGAAVADFDELVLAINGAAQLIANVAFAANIASERRRAEFFAKSVIENYDSKLGPLIAQLRARLARPNPFAAPPEAP